MQKEIAQKHATALFKYIKKSLADARKLNKEKNLTGWSRIPTSLDLCYYADSVFNKKTNKWDRPYVIDVHGKKVVTGLTNKWDIEDIVSELNTLFAQQKKVKGWTNLNIVTEKVEMESSGWNSSYLTLPVKVALPDPQCSEYKSLRNYLSKFGGYTLRDYQLFRSYMSGKRGYLFSEDGERQYLDSNPKRCADFLADLRKYRGSKDTMAVSFKQEKYIDPDERRYSEYAEIECSGELRHYLQVTIKSPNGKVKYEGKIY